MASAFCVALGAMLFSELKGRVPFVQLARWQMAAAFVMTAAVSLAVGGWHTLEPWQIWLLLASGTAGIAIAGTTYFAAIHTVGPRITALLFSLTSPFALVLGYAVLGETITLRQGLGIALVLAGIVLAIGIPWRLRWRGDRSAAVPAAAPATMPTDVAPPVKARLWPGIVLGVVTAFGQAIGTLLARPVMASGVEPFTAMAVRSSVAVLLFVALAAMPFGRGAPGAVRISTVTLALLAAIVGTALGMSLLLAALESGGVGIVSTLASMTPVLILPMVWIRTRERPSLMAWVGASLAIGGTALISLG